jgi:hypothetical protein
MNGLDLLVAIVAIVGGGALLTIGIVHWFDRGYPRLTPLILGAAACGYGFKTLVHWFKRRDPKP